MKFENIYLETKRTSIRMITENDGASMYKVYSDPDAMEYWSSPPFNSESQAKEKIRTAVDAFDSGESLLLAVILKESNELIGTLSLFNIHDESRRAEVGYILSKQYWRKGLMAESLEALIDFCFNSLKLNRLEADIDPGNKASAALLEKCNFRVEGLLKERWIVNGEPSDSEIYGLVRAKNN